MCSIDFDCVSSNSYKNNFNMKANEAPEKIILSADRDTQIIYDEWVTKDLTDNIKIEYTRTNAFIEKAKEAFCKAICNGNPPRSTCTSLGTCRAYDRFIKLMRL